MTEETPNPAVIKFLPGRTVMERGVLEFKTKEDVSRSPLAEKLFSIAGVEGLFYGYDFISVTKNDILDWDMLKPQIMAAVMEHFTGGHPIFHDGMFEGVSEDIEEDEISAQIRELIETRVRPMVAQDGGDIIFKHFDDGIAYLEMRGACAGCPSSTMTLKQGIENMLKHHIPEVQEVRAVE